MDFSVIYYIKTSVVGISSIIPMHSSIPVSVIPMLHCIYISVQAENENFSDPTFLEAFDLNFHMPGHFLL